MGALVRSNLLAGELEQRQATTQDSVIGRIEAMRTWGCLPRTYPSFGCRIPQCVCARPPCSLPAFGSWPRELSFQADAGVTEDAQGDGLTARGKSAKLLDGVELWIRFASASIAQRGDDLKEFVLGALEHQHIDVAVLVSCPASEGTEHTSVVNGFEAADTRVNEETHSRDRSAL
jgi:hypothetical protein